MNEADWADIVASLPDDRDAGIVLIQDVVKTITAGPANSAAMLKDLIEAYAVLQGYLLAADRRLPELTSDNASDLHNEIFNNVKAAALVSRTILAKHTLADELATARARYEAMFSPPVAIALSDHDLTRAQDLIDQLRAELTTTTALDPPHRQRLLRRLEKLQAELHKTMSDLDTFWAAMGDAALVLGKCGEDVKPLVDRLRELSSIFVGAARQSIGLPPGAGLPFLLTHDGQPSDDQSAE